MNKTRTMKVNNLIEFAENRLITKVKRGEIYSYSVGDILDNALKLRRYMDTKKNDKIIIPKMNKEEVRLKRNLGRCNYYYKTGK